MNVSDITTIITTIGFPIACCIWMAYYMTKLNEQHAEEVEKLRASLDNNTKVMTRICAKLDIKEDDI